MENIRPECVCMRVWFFSFFFSRDANVDTRCCVYALSGCGCFVRELFAVLKSYRSNEHDRSEQCRRATQRFYIKIDWRIWRMEQIGTQTVDERPNVDDSTREDECIIHPCVLYYYVCIQSVVRREESVGRNPFMECSAI